ncbi:MAG: preprotein translocase subunit SecG, partial [Rhodoblastus sp.]
LIAIVLMQRSEGGALGIGGGGGGNFMSARGTGNVLTRTTAILAAAFFATSIILTVLTRYGDRPSSILDNVPAANTTTPAPVGGSQDGSVLDQLDRMSPEPTTPSGPQVPQ